VIAVPNENSRAHPRNRSRRNISRARRRSLAVLIIDPAHTDTGEWLEQSLAVSPQVKVTKLDIAQLRQAPAPAAGSVVIWLSPEPTLYQNEAQQRWRETLANNQIGLFILGLLTTTPPRALTAR